MVINCIFTRALFAMSLWDDTSSSEASIKVTLISRKTLTQLFVFQQCQWLINNKVAQAYLGQSGYIILSRTLIPVNQFLTSDFLENMPAGSRQCSSLNNNARDKNPLPNKRYFQVEGSWNIFLKVILEILSNFGVLRSHYLRKNA